MLISGQDLGDGQLGHYIVNDFTRYANHIKLLTIYLIGVTEKKKLFRAFSITKNVITFKAFIVCECVSVCVYNESQHHRSKCQGIRETLTRLE